MVKVLHCSDIHLGAKFNFLNEAASNHRKALQVTFVNIMEAAIEGDYDVVCITGDLFDSTAPNNIDKHIVLEQIGRLKQKGIYCAILPGNHDRLKSGSVYLQAEFQQAQDRFLHIFQSTSSKEWIIEELDITVYGNPILLQKSKQSPLKALSKNSKTRFHLGLAHGSLSIQGQSDNYPFTLEEIKSADFDYLALGDWHSTKEVSKSPPAWYAGSPELIGINQKGSGFFLEIHIDEQTTVTPRKIGQYSVKELEVSIQELSSLQELLDIASKEGDMNAFLKLTLTGFKKIDFELNIDELSELLDQKFYYHKIYDKTTLLLSDEELKQYPGDLVIGKYIRLMQNKKKKNEDKDYNRKIDEAIQVGVNLLKEHN